MRNAPTRFLLAVAAGLIVLSCTADRINEPADGALRIFFVVENPSSKGSAGIGRDDSIRSSLQVDSIRIVVRDARDRDLAVRKVGYAGSGDVLIEMSLQAARDLTVLMSGDGPGGDATRGSLYFGRQTGITIERGRTTEATLVLSGTGADAPVVEGEAGSPSYIVRWSRIPFASSYTLREHSASGSQDFSIAGEDTFRLFTPGEEMGIARLARSVRSDVRAFRGRTRTRTVDQEGGAPRASSGAARAADLRSYRVRGELPLGPGIFGDSASVDLSAWFDLPRVFDATPADSATGVLDTSEISIRFDRVMGGSLDTLVTLRELWTGVWVLSVRAWFNQNRMFRPAAPLGRGGGFRVGVSTKVRDAAGRPLDQDSSREGLQAFVSDFRVEAYDPLRVASVTPADAATDVSITPLISLTLLRAVDRATITSTSFTLSGPSGSVAATRLFGSGDALLTLTPSEDLLYDTTYTVRLETTVLDAARGEPLDQNPSDGALQPFVSTFRTIAQPTGPSIVSTAPAAGEPNHIVYDPAVVVFDSAIRIDTFRPGDTVLLQRDLNDLWVNVELRPPPYTTDGRVFTLIPVQDMRRNTAHRLIVRGGSGGVRGSDGIAFDQDYTAPGFQDFVALFTTEQNVRVETSFPADGASQVPWDIEVRLTLDGAIQSESVADTTFALLLDELPVSGSRWISSDLREIRFRPDAPLLGYRTYTIWAGAGLKSSRGGALDQDYSLDGHQAFSSRFTTVEETVSPRVDSIDPPAGALDVSPGQRVTVVFSEPVRSFLVLDNYYITQTDSAGVKVPATVTVASDNLSAELVPTSPLAPLTVYHVHVEPLVTDLFGNGLDQDPAKPGKQKFHSTFTTVQERVPPQVVAISPLDGSTGVPVDGSVAIDFTEPVDQGSVSSALRIGTGSLPHPGGIAFEVGGQRVIWTPASPLLYGSLYDVRVDTLLVDLAGNRLDQYPDGEHPGSDPFVSSFSTELDLHGPELQSVAPEDGSIGVAVDTAPVLLFSEGIDPLTIGPTGIGLADSLGQDVVVEPVLSTDGREVTLAHAVPLAVETRYSITVYPALTDLQGNPFDADPSTAGNQPLTTVFRTRVENIAPFVVSVVPADSAADVAVSTAVTVTFSEPCDPATVGPTTFLLLLDGSSVPGSRELAPGDTVATFVPASDLQHSALYEVRVEGVEDLKGNLLDQDPLAAGEQPFTSSFTTAPEPAPSPSVVSVSPADGTLDVDPAVRPRIVFSRAMDLATFTPQNPGLLKGGFAVPATRAGEPGDTSFVLTPEDPLAGGAYTWFVSPALKDTQGNSLDQDPLVPGAQWFEAGFEVGKRPVANAGAGVCSDGGDLSIPFDGSGSVDPDGQIAHIAGAWSWGDGTTTAFSDFSGLRATHAYACADLKGCDGLDNDGDGQTDETGPGGCDESYRVILSLRDESGLESADTTGVAFCAFLARTSDPLDGAAGVDTLRTIRVWLSAPCNPVTLGPASVWLAIQGGDSAAIIRGTEDGDRVLVLVLDPASPLLPDTTYVIHVAGSLQASTGSGFDQLPCDAGVQEFTASFRTEQRPVPPPGLRKDRPAAVRLRDERP